jgi:truncated hemoglobin YjbI
MSTSYGPDVATVADASRATMHSAATLADPSASRDDRQAALEAEIGAYESYWQAHGHPAYAEHTARQGLIREHADRGLSQIGAEHQAQAEHGGPEAGE